MYHEIAMLLSDAVIMRINTEGRKKFLSYNDIVNSSEIIADQILEKLLHHMLPVDSHMVTYG